MEYYSALKRKAFLTHATMWVKLEDVMLKRNRAVTKGQIPYDIPLV